MRGIINARTSGRKAGRANGEPNAARIDRRHPQDTESSRWAEASRHPDQPLPCVRTFARGDRLALFSPSASAGSFAAESPDSSPGTGRRQEQDARIGLASATAQSAAARQRASPVVFKVYLRRLAGRRPEGDRQFRQPISVLVVATGQRPSRPSGHRRRLAGRQALGLPNRGSYLRREDEGIRSRRPRQPTPRSSRLRNSCTCA